MLLSKLARSSAFRNGLLYAALFGGCTLLLFAVVYWQTVGYMQGQLRIVVASELQTLLAHYRDDGLPGLQGAISDRLEGTSTSATHYLLLDAQGHRLAGDLPISAAALGSSHPTLTSTWAPSKTHDATVPILAEGVRLAHGAQLVVAHDAGQLVALRRRLAYALA